MHIEDMLKKAAAFAGYTDARFDDDKVFIVRQNGFFEPWNPLDIPTDNEELIAKLQADNQLYMSQGSHGRIDVYGSHYDTDGAIAAQLVITELHNNYNQNAHQAKRMAITKLAATLYDLRGVS